MAERLKERALAKPLFDGWQETMIYSCLEGVLGEVYAECENGIPVSAACVIADFAFFAGKPSPSLVTYDFGKPFLILTPRNLSWQRCMEDTLAPNVPYPDDVPEWDNDVESAYGKVRKVCRYAMRKDTVFDCTHLETLRSRVPRGYTLHPIREQAYRECMDTPWSRDLVMNYPSYEDYHAHTRGYVVRETASGTIVAGASAYTYYSGGIEIEVDTREDHRKRGLATVCASALILSCLAYGQYPSWDAANLTSVRLAEKLGYTLAYPYPVYHLTK